MRIFVRNGLVTLAFYLAPQMMLAQELHTQYEFLGFSDDLQYCAYEMYSGRSEEEVPAFSIIYFIDVDKNDYATRPIKTTNELELTAVRETNRKLAAGFMKQYKINGLKLGQPIGFVSEETYRGPEFNPIQPITANNKNYTLTLSTVGTGAINGMDQEEKLVIVELESNGKKRVLQPAVKNPKSWGMVIGFQFLKAYWLENKIAVFVEYQGPGFEGYPDRQQMIVTGVLD